MKRILVIGSGPIVIGQGAEFDYSGSQACKVLKEEGIYTILVNNNPATIMTDREMADAVYLEPIKLEFLKKIIEKERPDAIIPGIGGQTGLNAAVELHESGVLDAYGIEVLGTSIEGIKRSEDRDAFKKAMEKIDIPVLESYPVTTYKEALETLKHLELPLVVRPAYTLGGTGGGICHTMEEFETVTKRGLSLSPVSQVLIEKSLMGWKEIEYEIMRDGAGNCITICNMENIDPLGVHTGDSIVVAPSQTLSDREYQMLRKAAIDIAGELEIVGGCNVQYALDPDSFQFYVIEVNPRVSRSSALASKATGYPIAKVSTKIALGYHLDQIENDITKNTYACYEPSLDYCVIKFPKWAFDKFPEGDNSLGTTMKATGEVMAIGNNFEAAFLKAIRSLELNQYSLMFEPLMKLTLTELFDNIKFPKSDRIFYVAELLRREVTPIGINARTGIDLFFLHKLKNIVMLENFVRKSVLKCITKDQMTKMKRMGMSDAFLSKHLLDHPSEFDVRTYRKNMGIVASYKMVDTCSGEFEALTPYYYSTYDPFDENERTDRKKVVVVGSGPIKIGQGVEFDYCSVHGIMALKSKGYEGIIINNNPETVSTDFDVSDKLYFEPLTIEDVLNVVEYEQPEGVIVQYAGNTGLKLADSMKDYVLGTDYDQIDASENRERFYQLINKAGIKHPEGTTVTTPEKALEAAEGYGYPVLVRPSYVIGGLGMKIVETKETLATYVQELLDLGNEDVLVDNYLNGKEVEVDAICNGSEVLIPGIMEHLERAGIHSGDSISIYPPPALNVDVKNRIFEITKKLSEIFEVKGLMNIQLIIQNGEIYIIEVNLRASRTVPFLSKITGVPMIKLSTGIMLGQTLAEQGYSTGLYPEKDVYAVKLPVFSNDKLVGIDIALGPNMKSTGEIMCIEDTVERALLKGFISLGNAVDNKGKVVCQLDYLDEQLYEVEKIVDGFASAGLEIVTDQATVAFCEANHIKMPKMSVSDDLVEVINDGDVKFVVTNLSGEAGKQSFGLRRYATEKKIPCVHAYDTYRAFVKLINTKEGLDDLQVYDIKKIG
ncbi:carbamoyl-phosphate synthase (glutamine-hydrolyzing) large subunit [Fusibacter paucivorans]|uniref:carbamoyl-phosphate synthase (ammonia) n=1 Tax=Fusibacter paucivorans TaxID=76009 RepID=A0ABS5PQX9_9FIRM|nr:carbamoyl-phosphate synthase (glutamine-hydrolyzing) large subunit [Fusibacter paucivorans]MBS7526457.1 carbamoyl-phosphate synthase (glutamine-hydrolyzing) large subunit [Fusibacter paucivorans]